MGRQPCYTQFFPIFCLDRVFTKHLRNPHRLLWLGKLPFGCHVYSHSMSLSMKSFIRVSCFVLLTFWYLLKSAVVTRVQAVALRPPVSLSSHICCCPSRADLLRQAGADSCLKWIQNYSPKALLALCRITLPAMPTVEVDEPPYFIFQDKDAQGDMEMVWKPISPTGFRNQDYRCSLKVCS